MYTIKDLYDLNETIAAKLFEGKTYPWEVLADIGDFIMKLGPTLPKNEFNQIEDNIWVHKTVKIAPTASLTGPLIVDADTEIRPSAFVRGKAIVGKNCVVGNSTELKNVVLLIQYRFHITTMLVTVYLEHILIWEQVQLHLM